jgi:hypothetical protein
MMRSFYRGVISLYPEAYREAFSAEMAETYERAADECRKRGRRALLAFSLREISGLICGVFAERAAKWSTPETYVTSRCQLQTASDLPPEIVEVQSRLQFCLRKMEFAIAHHDFRNARFYSDEERATRTLLQRLINEQTATAGH